MEREREKKSEGGQMMEDGKEGVVCVCGDCRRDDERLDG